MTEKHTVYKLRPGDKLPMVIRRAFAAKGVEVYNPKLIDRMDGN